MKTSLKTLSLVAAASLTLAMAAQAQTTYVGNGASSFGGPVGNGSLTVSEDSSGMLTFTANSINGTTPAPNFNGNSLVVYIDSTTGGFTNTSTFTDASDGSREALSGYNPTNNPATRTQVNFSPGFAADYAIVFDGTGTSSTYFGNTILFKLGTDSSVNYVTSQFGAAANSFTLTFSATSIGLTTTNTSPFSFEGTLIADAAYRSNETIGTSITTPGTVGDGLNAGFTGTTTFLSADTFPVPEPGSIVCLGLGGAVLVGLSRRRMREV